VRPGEVVVEVEEDLLGVLDLGGGCLDRARSRDRNRRVDEEAGDRLPATSASAAMVSGDCPRWKAGTRT
jgi:hypothetical protein